MNRPLRSTLALCALASLALLAACGSPRQEPAMNSLQAAATAGEVAAALGRFSTSDSAALEQAALERLLATPLQVTVEVETLPRGVYEYDAAADEWVWQQAANVLELHWAFEHGGQHDAKLLVDWTADAPSTFVKLEDGSNREAPQGARAWLDIDGAQVGELGVGGRYAVNACGYSEPVEVDLDGYLGDEEQRLELNGLAFGLAEYAAASTFSSSGEVSFSADDDSLVFDWQVSLTGDITRDDATCHVTDASVSSGQVAVGIALDVFGRAKSLSVAAGFSDVAVSGAGISSISLVDGRIEVDGGLAVAFDGVLDDANGNGVPGENLTLRFAKGETMSLEEFLQSFIPGLSRAL